MPSPPAVLPSHDLLAHQPTGLTPRRARQAGQASPSALSLQGEFDVTVWLRTLRARAFVCGPLADLPRKNCWTISPAPCAGGDLASHPTIAMRRELNLGEGAL